MSAVPFFKKRRNIISAAVFFLVVGSAVYWITRAGGRKAGAEPIHQAEALKNRDGSRKYANHLVHETSPYLLLHAHNPVDWYPWGPEALERAKKEDKPIFLSVGYSTCYWCHVMERLVFSNAEIADLMNRWFINIKVDREERPDLDEVYMTATQIFTGHGGWPNSVFLTPDLKPFFAGTYFPPEEDEKFGRPSFPRVLQAMHDMWETRRQEVEQQSEKVIQIIERLQETRDADADSVSLDRNILENALAQLYDTYDSKHGGFDGAPKFPSDQAIIFLLDEYERAGESKPLETARHTLQEMQMGGIHDHLGGGFHRYATDGLWRVPHFEKMLYNQALLAKAYLKGYKLTNEEDFRRSAEGIFHFVNRVMTSPEGGFYSALDSETEGVEGEYYLWTEDEIRQVLGNDSDLFLNAYGLAPMPEGSKGVLYMPQPLEVTAKTAGMEVDDLIERLARFKQRLLESRQARPSPLLDTKIVTAWNGMMIDAYAYGYEVLGKSEYLRSAHRAAEFILNHLKGKDGTLMRTYRIGRANYEAYQEDYAFLAQGLLAIHRATGEERYLQLARDVADEMQDRFWDPNGGGFYFTQDPDQLIVRIKNPTDSAIPSGNSEGVNLLLDLADLTGEQAYRERAERTLSAFAGRLKESPRFFNRMLQGLALYLEHATPQIASAQTRNLRSPSLPKVSEGHVKGVARLSTDRPAAGEPFEAIVTIQVAAGWHINANPASLEFLVPTELSFKSDVALDVISIEYPTGAEIDLGFADQPLLVYDGRVKLRATLKLRLGVAPGTRGQMTLTVEYQACDDARCLPPSSLKLPLEFTVSS